MVSQLSGKHIMKMVSGVNPVKSLFLLACVIFFYITLNACSTVAVNKPSHNLAIVEKTIEAEDEEDFDDFGDEFAQPEEIYDPLASYNSFMTGVNDWLYMNILDPTARAYAYVMPQPVHVGIGNFFDNIFFPKRFVNNLLQLKVADASTELLRFVINSTIGVFGFWDAAKHLFDLEEQPEDFGQTLAFYGVGTGPHVVLPFLGPSNLRDSLSLSADWQMNNIAETNLYDANLDLSQDIMLEVLNKINYVSLNLGMYESLKADAFDISFFKGCLRAESFKRNFTIGLSYETLFISLLISCTTLLCNFSYADSLTEVKQTTQETVETVMQLLQNKKMDATKKSNTNYQSCKRFIRF